MKPVGDWGKNVSGRRDSRCKGSDGLGAQYVTHVAGAERAEARSELRTPAFTPCGMGSDERVLNRGSSSLTHKRITVTILRTATAYHCCYSHRGFPPGSAVKNLPANAGAPGLIPGSGRCPGEGNGNPLQCSCLESPMDRGTWWGYSSWGFTELDTT